MSTPSAPPPRPSKRLLDDAVRALDEAVSGPTASTSAPAKRPRALAPAKQNESTPELMRLLRKTPQSTAIDSALKPLRPLPDPRSLSELLDRLATFRIGGYSDAKPAALSAAQAAMCGWTNANDEREGLLCPTCDAKWIVIRPAEGWRDEAAIRAVAERFVSEHVVSCPWRTRQTPATIYRLPIASPATLAADTLRRAEALSTRAGDLVDVRTVRPADDQTDAIKNALLRYRVKAAPADDPIDLDPVIMLLALSGWAPPAPPASSLKRSSSSAPLRSLKSGLVLSCSLCHRDVCTWLFATDDRPALDPVRSHRPYCPHATSHAEAVAALLKLGAPTMRHDAAAEHRPRGAVRQQTGLACTELCSIARSSPMLGAPWALTGTLCEGCQMDRVCIESVVQTARQTREIRSRRCKRSADASRVMVAHPPKSSPPPPLQGRQWS